LGAVNVKIPASRCRPRRNSSAFRPRTRAYLSCRHAVRSLVMPPTVPAVQFVAGSPLLGADLIGAGTTGFSLVLRSAGMRPRTPLGPMRFSRSGSFAGNNPRGWLIDTARFKPSRPATERGSGPGAASPPNSRPRRTCGTLNATRGVWAVLGIKGQSGCQGGGGRCLTFA
jgi:hypothetical protein